MKESIYARMADLIKRISLEAEHCLGGTGEMIIPEHLWDDAHEIVDQIDAEELVGNEPRDQKGR